MMRFVFSFRPAILCGTVLVLVLSLPLAAQDYKFTVPTSQAWTDSGVDLHSGEMLAITASAGSGGCDPAGVASAAGQNLPVATALPGALIARLQDGGTAQLVGASQDLRVPANGHLYFGINAGGTAPCQGSIAVQVHVTPRSAAVSSTGSSEPIAAESLASGATSAKSQAATGASASGAQSAGAEKEVKDIKGALTTAAQTWLSGQFGSKAAATTQPSATSSATASGASAATAATTTVVPALKLSSSALDAQLRQLIDSLPRRVNDQFQHQGDMVNFVIVGSLQKVQDALTAADWHVADKDVKESVVKAAIETYEKKAYLTMPMSLLYLFGRVQDYGYEQAEPYAVVASRHHFRIWKAPFQWNGQDVWAGAGTHDIGFEKDQRNGSVTHKIDPAVDGERDNIGGTLQKTDKVKGLTYYLPPDPVQDARNATGGGYHSDGRILVIQLQ
jgi:hypothetical protein